MNDMKFIETLKQKRKDCDYSQSRLAQELQISRQNLNEIENGKTKASKEMKHILLHYLDYCNCTQPFTLTILVQIFVDHLWCPFDFAFVKWRLIKSCFELRFWLYILISLTL